MLGAPPNRGTTDGLLVGTVNSTVGRPSRQCLAGLGGKGMAEIRGSDSPFVLVSDSYFCGDSCRKGANLCDSACVHDVNRIWDNLVRVCDRCVPQNEAQFRSGPHEVAALFC